MKMISARKTWWGQRVATVCLLLVLLASVAGWFVARTQVFRERVAGHLSTRLGMPVRIDQAYIGWPYVLVLRGVEMGGAGEAFDLQLQSLRLGRRLRCWSLHVRGARVRVVPDLLESRPQRVAATLVHLAHLRDAGAIDIMRATAHLRERWRVVLQDVDIYWLDTDGHADAVLRQVQFHMQPLRLPSEWLMYYRLAYPGAAEHAFGGIRNLDWEWLTRGGEDYVELRRSGVLPPLQMDE